MGQPDGHGIYPSYTSFVIGWFRWEMVVVSPTVPHDKIKQTHFASFLGYVVAILSVLCEFPTSKTQQLQVFRIESSANSFQTYLLDL